MKGQYLRPSELLKLLKETGLSYWDIIGNPLPTFDSGNDNVLPEVEVVANYPYEWRVRATEDASNAPFLQRIRNNDTRAIGYGRKDLSTHILENDDNYVYPLVQERNGHLEYIPKFVPKGRYLDAASDVGDTIKFATPGDARYYAEHYKKYHPEFFQRFNSGSDEWRPILQYGKGKASKFLNATIGGHSDDIDDTIRYYMQAGYSPMQIAGILGNIAVENPNWDYMTTDSTGAKGMYLMDRNMQREAAAYRKILGKDYSDNAFVDAVLRGDKRLSKPWLRYGFEKGAGYLQRKYNNSGEAAKAFLDIFERAGKPDLSERIRSANDAYMYIMNRKLNELALKALTQQPDATRVDRPVVVTSRLRKPLQKELPLVVQEEPEEETILIPELLPSILPNPINWFNQTFGEDLPTFDPGKDGKVSQLTKDLIFNFVPGLAEVNDLKQFTMDPSLSNGIDLALDVASFVPFLGIGAKLARTAKRINKLRKLLSIRKAATRGVAADQLDRAAAKTNAAQAFNYIGAGMSRLANDMYLTEKIINVGQESYNHGKSGIHIKPSHRGKFTRYLKAHPGMTAEKAKHSKSAAVRRMATFALNARKWRH